MVPVSEQRLKMYCPACGGEHWFHFVGKKGKDQQGNLIRVYFGAGCYYRKELVTRP